MSYNFKLPERQTEITRTIHKIDAIIITRHVLGLMLSQAKFLIDNNFNGTSVPTTEFARFLRNAVSHYHIR